MKELIEYIALSLVDDPSQVVVSQTRTGGRETMELHVAKEDMGRVIGKGGRVANAMRILLRVAAAREGKQASLDVVEPR
ncbi:MAG: KH domain-containing protein [Anaerolineaceae bacterium]|nr:KH domain-containing protein [Anaerolineaceae bacterium]